MTHRRVILLGNNATKISDESHIGTFAGKELVTGGVLLDERRRRAYQIGAMTKRAISIRELIVDLFSIKRPDPLDDVRAIGSMVEHDVRIIARKERGTGRWKRAR